MKNTIDIGEWQTAPNGKRFRMFGSSIEWEPEIFIHGAMIPVSQADSVRTAFKISEEKDRKQRARTETKERRMGFCPLKSGLKCKKDCAFYSENGCMKNTETKGKMCPLVKHGCSEACMLYEDGCSIVRKWRK